MKNLKEYLKAEDIEFVRSAETPITIGTRRTILDCRKCAYIATLRSGTIMECSHLY